MKLSITILLLVIFFGKICYAIPVAPKTVDFLSGFKKAQVVNDILYCATETGLRIYDVKDRANPKVLSEIIVSDSANVDMEISGSYAYILSGYIFLEQSHITVVDVRDPARPQIVSKYSNLEDAQVTDILIHDHWLIVANGENVDFLNITDPRNLKRSSRITVTTPEGGVRGLALHEQTLFAVWSNLADGGLDAIDISDIGKPERIVTYYFPRLQGFSRPAGYIAGAKTAIYVSVPTLGLLVFDAEKPEYLVPVTSLEGQAYQRIESIYAEENFLFMDLVSFDDFDNREIAVFDISNGTSPSLIRQSMQSASVVGMDFDPASNECFLSVFAASGYGLGIFQLADGNLTSRSTHIVATPVDVATAGSIVFLTASDSLIAARNSGNRLSVIGSLRLPGETNSVKIVGTKAYVTATDNFGRAFLNVVSIANPAAMTLLGKFSLKNVQPYLSQDSFDVAGTTFYVSSFNRLTILDGSDLNKPKQIGSYRIQDGLGGTIVKVHNGFAFLGVMHFKADGDAQRIGLDLHVIDVRQPQAPKLVIRKMISFGTVFTGIAFKNGYLYMMFGGTGLGLLPVGEGQLAIVDVRSPAKPVVLHSGFTRKKATGYAEEIAFAGDLALIADGLDGVTVLNLANPSAPHIVATIPTSGYARAVAVDNNGQLHVADQSSYLLFQLP